MVGLKGPGKLLVASVGVAAINQVLIGCDTFGPPADERPGAPDFFMGAGGKVGSAVAQGGSGPLPPFPTAGSMPTTVPMGGFAGFGGQNSGGVAGSAMGGGGAGGTGGDGGGGGGGTGGGGAGEMGGMSAGDGGEGAGGDASGGEGAGGAEHPG